jgi:hypothetical protein
MSDRKKHRPAGSATLAADAQLSDREFFDAHPDQDIRRRLVVPGEVPRSLADHSIREVEVRNVEPGIVLRIFVDADGGPMRLNFDSADAGLPAILPTVDPDLFLTVQGRKQIVSCLKTLEAVSEFFVSCARFEHE